MTIKKASKWTDFTDLIYGSFFSLSPVLPNHNSIVEFLLEVPFAIAGSNLLQVGHVATQLLDGLYLLV